MGGGGVLKFFRNLGGGGGGLVGGGGGGGLPQSYIRRFTNSVKAVNCRTLLVIILGLALKYALLSSSVMLCTFSHSDFSLANLKRETECQRKGSNYIKERGRTPPSLLGLS